MFIFVFSASFLLVDCCFLSFFSFAVVFAAAVVVFFVDHASQMIFFYLIWQTMTMRDQWRFWAAVCQVHGLVWLLQVVKFDGTQSSDIDIFSSRNIIVSLLLWKGLDERFAFSFISGGTSSSLHSSTSVFTIADSYGDGICCSYGNRSWVN